MGSQTIRVVPAKLPNNARAGRRRWWREGGSAEGNAASETRSGPSAGTSAPSDLDRVRRVARKDKDARFTALLHHVDVDRLRAAYWAIRPKAAPGVDGVTWTEYGQDLEANLRDLHARVHRGSYRARPSRRVFIPKADGRLRPLGIAALEDKILQRALVEVLNAIYETDFLGFSYGFRPGRSPHDALDALAAGIMRKKVNWVLDGVNGKRNKEAGCRRPGRWMRCCTRDGGAGPGGLVALRGRPAGGGRKPPRAAPVKSRGGERRGKGAPSSASGVDQEGERERTTDEVSKAYQMTSKPGSSRCPGMSLAGCLLTGQAVSGMEVARAWSRALVRNVGTCRPDAAAGQWSGWACGRRRRENPKQRKLRGAEYRCGAQGRTVS